MSELAKKFVSFSVLFAMLLAPSMSSTANAQTAAAPSSVPNIQFEKYTLPNGMQVILHVDKKLPVVHVNQWYYVGSAN